MWNHLKKLIASGMARRTRRRGDAQRFRAGLESLESRSMLSATIGVMAIDFEANTITIAVWASQPTPQANVWQALDTYDPAPWETRGVSNNAHRAGGLGGRLIQQVQHNSFGDGLPKPGGGLLDNGAIGATAPDVTTDPQLDPRLNSTNAAAAQSDGIGNSFALSARFPRNAPARIADFVSTLTSPTTTPANSSVSTTSSLNANDAVFGAYGADSLLLAADANPLDSDDDRRIGDEFESAGDGADLEKTPSSVAAEELAASLDALRRERVAIDEVLAELHEVKLREESHAAERTAEPDTDAAHQQDESMDTEDRFLNASDADPSQQVSGAADGGMVLLEPSGDANSSAFDLSATFLGSLSGGAATPLGVEASIGVYQAIDVGIGETPAASRETPPIAQPAAAARPSVSAENAPAKKSEQPT